EEPAGTLWIATGTKLVRYDLATHERHELGAEAGLPERKIGVVAAHDGVLWIGHANGGLYRAPTAVSPWFERVALPDAAGDGTIGGIAFDEGRTWVTTSHGLYVLERGRWHGITTKDGLRDDGLLFLVARRDHSVCASYLAPYGLTCLSYRDGAVSDVRHLDES